MDKENIHRGFDLPPLEELKEREDERGLRPLRLSDFNGQTEIKSKRWTIFSITDLPAWEKRLCPASSPMK